MIIETGAKETSVVMRGSRKARNKFYKLGRPMITSGDKKGQRDSERIVAQIRIIPNATDMFGRRKLTGFTVDEIRQVADGGGPLTVEDDENKGRVLASLSCGPGLEQWTKEELYEIVDTVTKEGGPLLLPSRMDQKDLERLRLTQPQEVRVTLEQPVSEPVEDEEPPKRRGRPPKNVAEPIAEGA